MKLWVADPARATMVPDGEQPQWAPFETVHVSLNAKALLAKHPPAGQPTAVPEAPIHPIPDSRSVDVPEHDLQLQIRELTTGNLELRGRLTEQNKRMDQLRDQLDQLRLELDEAKSKELPSRTIPAP